MGSGRWPQDHSSTRGAVASPGSARQLREHRLIREHPPAAGSTHRPRVHRRLQGTPADRCAPPTPGAPRARSPRLPTGRAAAFCPQSEAWPRGDVASSALARRRFSRSQGTAESLKSRPALLLFLSLSFRCASAPTSPPPPPPELKLSGHPCGSLSSSSRYSAAPGSGGGGSAGGRFDGVGTGSGVL